jgi:uncharacterized OB-fold protein
MNTVAKPERPVAADVAKPYWDGLAQGELRFQRCKRCNHAWLPARQECPRCLTADWQWQAAGGQAKLVSWVVYHRAFNEAFKDRVPYTCAVVELAEGPRMISNIVRSVDPKALKIDQPLSLTFERDGDAAVPRFKPAG